MTNDQLRNTILFEVVRMVLDLPKRDLKYLVTLSEHHVLQVFTYSP
jgi:hypothetical protein